MYGFFSMACFLPSSSLPSFDNFVIFMCAGERVEVVFVTPMRLRQGLSPEKAAQKLDYKLFCLRSKTTEDYGIITLIVCFNLLDFY